MFEPLPLDFPYPRDDDEWFRQAAYVRSVMPEWGPPDESNGSTLRRFRHLMKVPGYPALLEEYEDVTFYTMLDDLIAKRDNRTWMVFETVWDDAPDSPHIHSWTGWGRLCDLCSERGVIS